MTYESTALPIELPRLSYTPTGGDYTSNSLILLCIWRIAKGVKMQQATLNQWAILENQDTYILTWVEAFLVDRQAQGLSKGTLHFYRYKLKLFMFYCDVQEIKYITQITPVLIREYLLYLERKGHNPGGIHACFKALKTFLFWWEEEIEPEGWKNPIRKVKAPKIPNEQLQPVKLEIVQSMLTTCDSSLIGKRDKAIMLCLLDTGTRAAEFCALNLEDIDKVYGSLIISKGKGGKTRSVFLGKKARRSVRAYFRERKDHSPALWITNSGTRITYWGLREIIRRRAIRANVPNPGLHDFRRAFALQCLRNGMDVYSLQKLMGHSDLQVLKRYLAQTTEDIKEAHRIGSPVDNSNL
jgi:integrase/recombinase XerD